MLPDSDDILVLNTKTEFWRTCISHFEPNSFTICKQFSDEVGGDSKYDFLGDIVMMKFITIWRLHVTQETNIFKMTRVWCYRLIHDKRSIQCVRQTHRFECNRNRNYTDRNLYSTCKLTFKKLLLVKFCCSIKKNDSYSYLKRLLKYSPHFQLLTNVTFSSTLLTKTTSNRLSAELDMRIWPSSVNKICKYVKQWYFLIIFIKIMLTYNGL